MKLLYILPHPDDESFGPAPVIHKYLNSGHEVHLLTLTKGGATKQRHLLNLSVEEMGDARYKEMLCVEKTLGLSSMKVLDLPDSGLKEMDPQELETIIHKYILKIKPHVLVTYPVHGISGFYDHLVCHAIVKRVFMAMKSTPGAPQRLAFFGLQEEDIDPNSLFQLTSFKKDEIDCLITVGEADIIQSKKALDCYKTYQQVIEKSGIKNMLKTIAPFEFFMESFSSPVRDLFYKLD